MAYDITESRKLVIAYLEKVQQDILSRKKIANLTVVQSATGGTLYAPFYAQFLEDGRGPTSPTGPYPPGKKLIDVIKAWIARTGLPLNAYAVTYKIHKEGTLLYRKGGKSGVLSIPLNQAGIENLFEQISDNLTKEVSSEIYTPISGLTGVNYVL